MARNLTVEELEESEIRFRSIFENSMDAILLTNPSTGTILMANPAACRLFGMTQEELKNPGRQGVLIQTGNIQAAITPNKVGNARNEVTYRRKDGTTFIGEVASSTFTDANGLTQSTLIIRDISSSKKVQEDLQESQERFRLVAEAARVLVYELEIVQGVIKVFRGEDVLGYEPGEIPTSYDWWLTQIHPDDKPMILQKSNEIIEKGQDQLLEYRIKRKQGEYITVHDMVKAVKNEQGTVNRLVCGLRDISERKNAEEAIKEEEERLELAQRVAHMGSWEFFVKEDKAIWSKELFRIFRLEPQKLGPNIAEYSKFVHPESAKRVATIMRKLFSDGKLGDSVNFDYRIIRPGGEIIDLHSERLITEVGDDGKAKRIIGIEQDITERKKIEAALRYERSRLRTVVDNMPVGVIIVDQHGRALMLNKALNNIWQGRKPLETMKDYTQYEAWDAKSGKKINPTDWPVSIAMQTGKPSVQREFYIERFDGSKGAMLTSAVPILSGEGKVVGAVGVAQDITERKQLEHQIEEYTKNLEKTVEERTRQLQDKERLAAIGETAGMVGHDIRNPLQAIVSELFLARQAMLSHEGMGKNDALESIQLVQEQVDYITKIVSDLQDYARHLKPEYTNVDLSGVISDVFDTIKIANNIKLNIDVKGSLLICSDPTFLKRSLTNLVNNAIQAMPDGGQLGLNVSVTDRTVLIVVSDTGRGIPDDVKPHIFKPLVTTKAKGQGLGLAVVKRLIEAMNGQVSFDSEEGKGTKFTIQLPLAQ